MEIIKELDNDSMHDIVKCPYCRGKEYYGMMIWFNGHQYCRMCTYERWQKEGYEAAKAREDVFAAKHDTESNYDNLRYWKPSDTDYVFPIYEDGVNYYEKEE